MACTGPTIAVSTGRNSKVAPYLEAITLVGGNPVALSPGTVQNVDVEEIDALILSGGKDVTPERYRQIRHSTARCDGERDDLEFTLLARAEQRGIPVLGICRGLQLINVYLGGTLIQHLPDRGLFGHLDRALPRNSLLHGVTLEPGTLQEVVGARSISVNSNHHQAIDALGRDLRVSAASPDGVIEGIEALTRPWLAVQWHPEELVRADDERVAKAAKRLFEDLVKSASSGEPGR